MSFELKKVVEKLTPPLLLNVLKSKFGSYRFTGHYSTWEAAKRSSRGYDSEDILNKVKESLQKVKRGEAVYERDSVLFDEIEYSWPLLTALLWIASCQGNRLNLVDFGGSLGSSYFQNRLFLKHLTEFKWTIVEQKHFVECGKQHFEDEHLQFHYNVDECREKQHPNVILFLSVIQYLEDPYSLLEKISQSGFDYIVFDRTTFVERGEKRIAVQRVSSKINEASYPLWLFNLNEFITFFKQRDYELVAQFDNAGSSGGSFPRFKGFVFQRVAKHVHS